MAIQIVNREKLLLQLEAVQPGLSTREIIEQSSCFVFQNQTVMTFNDEIACTHECELKVEGAVQAAPLLSVLRKMPETELEVEVADGYFVLIGKRRRAEIRHENDILLHIDKVEKPTKWVELHGDFLEGVGLVQHCASKDASQFKLTCIHLHPDFIEACDNFQATRVKMKTGVKASMLVRRDSLKHVASLGMTDFCETETWIHFRNADGLVLSCRRYMVEYHNIDSLLDFKGEPITLPKGLKEATDLAEVFSAENSEDNVVTVQLRPDRGGMLRITGEGACGRFREVKDLKYSGPPMEFLIAPKLLTELTEKHNEAEIAKGRLRVDGGKWVYMTCLTAPDESKTSKTLKEKVKGD